MTQQRSTTSPPPPDPARSGRARPDTGPVEMATDVMQPWLEHPVFGAAGPAACADLARRYLARGYAEGEELVLEGEPVDHLHVILRGAVRLALRGLNGLLMVSAHRRAPLVLGDEALFEGGGFGYAVTVAEDVLLALVPLREHLDFLEQHPAAMKAHLRLLARARREGIERERLISATVEQRVASYLLGCLLSGPEQSGRPWRPRLPSRRLIAESTGITERSVVRTIARWRQVGVVTSVEGVEYIPASRVLEALLRPEEPPSSAPPALRA